MPSWKIHSKIGSDILKQIKVNRKYFMIGNLIPDQDKYNIGDLRVNVSRVITHYVSEEDLKIGINLPDYDRFYNKYKDIFNNPVIMGYLVHLLTDYYWNKYIYDKYFIKKSNKYIGVKLRTNEIYKCEFNEMNTMKQKDFEIFNNSLTVRKNNFRYCLNSNYFEELEEIRIKKHNIFLIGKYLNSSHKREETEDSYTILNEKECFKITKECEDFIIKYLKSKSLIEKWWLIIEVYIVRHGQTDYNLLGRIAGRIDVPLNDKGKQDAYDVKEKLKDIKFDKVYSSPLMRAYETANIITNLPIIKDKRIIERDNGELEGRLKSEIIDMPDFNDPNETKYNI